MGRTAIITDSIGCLPQEILDTYSITLVPPNIYFNGEVYRDWLDITPAQAYELLERAPESFSTSGAPPADFVRAFQEVSKWADGVLCITLSAKVSTVYNAAEAARDLAREEMPDLVVEVLDSGTVTGAEGFIVLAAARVAATGATHEKVLAAALAARDQVGLVFVLETIKHAYRTGRVPRAATQLGALFSVKPLLTWENGTAHLIGMTRSKEKGTGQILEFMHKKVGGRPVRVAVHHANALEEGEKLKRRVLEEFDCVEIWLSEVSPIMVYSMGKGALGLAFQVL